MIRDDISVARAIIDASFKLATTDKRPNYDQGVLDLAGELLWPERPWAERRERLGRMYDAHRALFVKALD